MLGVLGDQLMAYQLELHHLIDIAASLAGYTSLLILILALVDERRSRKC